MPTRVKLQKQEVNKSDSTEEILKLFDWDLSELPGPEKQHHHSKKWKISWWKRWRQCACLWARRAWWRCCTGSAWRWCWIWDWGPVRTAETAPLWCYGCEGRFLATRRGAVAKNAAGGPVSDWTHWTEPGPEKRQDEELEKITALLSV